MLPQSRRQLLQFLLASPLLAATDPAAPAPLKDPASALSVLDFEAAARAALPPAHFGYMATGVDDDFTLRANREGFQHYQLRPRRLTDVSKIDTTLDLFGTRYASPIFLSPTGNQRAFHPEAEMAVARAVAPRNQLMILSTMTNSPIEDVAKAVGRPIWYQLYCTNRWTLTEQLIRHAEDAGCPAIAWTVDTMAGRNTETFERLKRLDTRTCANCHTPGGFYSRKRMFDGIDATGLTTQSDNLTWKDLDRMRKFTKVKLLLKGIETREDARLCLEHGLDGIIVSNHGGRAEESGRGTIECLPEVLDAASGKIPVFIDGGFRRGSDVFKALALGAKAVGVGRPYLWGLSAFGQPGVERVLDILNKEFSLIMKQCGTANLAAITPNHIRPKA